MRKSKYETGLWLYPANPHKWEWVGSTTLYLSTLHSPCGSAIFPSCLCLHHPSRLEWGWLALSFCLL